MSADSIPFLTVGQCATLACLLEATAPKVGNVHRGADFEDLTFTDLVVSAVAMGPQIEAAGVTGIGRAVLDAVTATSGLVGTNSNLGIALLLAPLAAVPRTERLTTSSVQAVLAAMWPQDSRMVYAAIQLAKPGGLGAVSSMDVAGEAPDDLLDAMRAAADRDLVARQYAENFSLVLECVLPWLIDCGKRWSLTESIVYAHVKLLAEHPDSLIVRKCGAETGHRASALARQALERGEPGHEAYYQAVADLDFWMRSDGHRRNPGTTADLIAAGLFAGLRDGLLPPPWR
jgi:triphosphoribosyl-dephospho-CoA synthase